MTIEMSRSGLESEDETVARVQAPLTASKVVIGDTTFTFRKALPIEQFLIFEKIRPHLVPIADILREAWAEDKGDNREEIMVAYGIKAVAALPTELVQIVLHELSKHVLFTNPNVPTQTVVANDIDTAFAGMGIVRIYEVLVRAICVNFGDSLDELLSIRGLLQGSED